MIGTTLNKTLALATAVLIGAVCCGENTLMKYLPGRARYVLSVDVKALNDHPFLAGCRDGIAKSAEVDVKDIDRAKTDLAKVRSVMLVGCGSQKGLALIEAAVDLNEVEAKLTAWGVKFEKSAIDGKTALLIKTENSLPELNRTIAVIEVAPSIYMVSDKKDTSAALKSVLAQNKKLAIVEPAGAPEVWGFANMYYIANGAGGQNASYGQYIRAMKTLSGQLKLTGEKRDTAVFSAKIACNDSKSAAQISAMLLPMVMMGANLAFAEDPELGTEFTQKFKCVNNGSDVDFTLTVSPDFGAKLIEFAQKKNATPECNAAESDDTCDEKAPAPAQK
ncbi:MAG: hypothetical protein PHI35_06165 [Victivallaceae bacterium]|nr:hypothetical protein [Victivallaceae bacterium]